MLKEQLTNDMKVAMKNADPKTVGVLRLMIAAINNKAIEKRSKIGSDVLTDDEIIQVLMSEEKKRKDSIVMFEQGGRSDLADKEKGELAIIAKYLPQRLSQEETEKEIDRILKETGAKEFGQAMKEVTKQLRGKIDGKMASEILKEKLK